MSNNPSDERSEGESPTSDQLDQADIKRLASGDDAALNDLMGRHAVKLFHYLVRCLQNEEDAADGAQKIFLSVYQNRAKFDATRRFSTWLYAIASNLVKDCYRFRSRHPQVSLDAGNESSGEKLRDSLREGKPTPSESLQEAERAQAVRSAVMALPEELRIPLILFEYEEHSQVEIGEILDCSPKAVETRIYRARQQLRSSLGWLLEKS